MSCCDPGCASPVLQHKIEKHLFFVKKRWLCVHFSTSTSSGFNSHVLPACNWGKRNLPGHVVQKPLQFSCRRGTNFSTTQRSKCIFTIIPCTYNWHFLARVLPPRDCIIYEPILNFRNVLSLWNNNISELNKISPGSDCTTRPHLYMSKILEYDDFTFTNC